MADAIRTVGGPAVAVFAVHCALKQRVPCSFGAVPYGFASGCAACQSGCWLLRPCGANGVWLQGFESVMASFG